MIARIVLVLTLFVTPLVIPTLSIAQDGKTADALVADGKSKAGRRDFKGALVAFTSAIELDANCVAAWFGRAEVRRSIYEPADAIKDYDKAIELDAKHADAYRGRARCHAELENFDQALADCNKAVELAPKDIEGLLARADVNQSSGKWADAINDRTRIIEFTPQDASGYSDRAEVYLHILEYDKAIADYTRAIELTNHFIQFAYEKRCRAHLRKGDLDKALNDANKCIIASPVAFFGLRGDVYAAMGDLDKALEDYSTAIKKTGGTSSHLDRARLYWRKGDLKAARADFDSAIELSGGGFYKNLGYCARGVFLLRTNEVEAALKDFKAADEGWARQDVARCLLALGKTDDAIAAFTKAIENNPKWGMNYADRALAYKKKDDLVQARADAQKAVEIAEKAIARDSFSDVLLMAAAATLSVRASLAKSVEDARKDLDRAFELLARAVGIGRHNRHELDTHPDLSLLRPDERYKKLVATLK